MLSQFSICWLSDWIFLFATVFRCRPLHQGIREKPDENGDDFFRLAAWLIASFRSVFSSSQRLRVACISAIIDMALLVSFHAALLSFGNASMMSRSVYEVALSGSTIFRRSATRRAGSVSPLFLEFSAGNLYFQVKPVNQTILFAAFCFDTACFHRTGRLSEVNTRRFLKPLSLV